MIYLRHFITILVLTILFNNCGQSFKALQLDDMSSTVETEGCRNGRGNCHSPTPSPSPSPTVPPSATFAPPTATPIPSSPTATPAPPSDVPYNLGTLPPELVGLRWPSPPTITNSVTVANSSELNAALAVNGRRITILAGTYNGLQITGVDQELVFQPGAQVVGQVNITLTQARTRIIGGRFSGGNFSIHGARDLLMNGMYIDNGTTENSFQMTFLGGSFGGRGTHRTALINSTYRGRAYASYTAPGGVDFNQDIILANNDFEIYDTVESLIRWQDVTRGVVVDSRLASSGHHTFRAHYNTRNIWVARNQIEGSGSMFGVNPGSVVEGQIGILIYEANNWYHRQNSLLQRNDSYPRVQGVRRINNNVYTANFGLFDQSITGPNDTAENNRHLGAPIAPPVYNGGADH